MSEPLALTPERLRAMPLPAPEEHGDKDGRGRVLIVAGSREMPGAALLAGEAALSGGAGKLQIATAASVAPGVALRAPEALVMGFEETAEGDIAIGAEARLGELVARSDGLLIGPGMIDRGAASALTAALLTRKPRRGVVVDAAALCSIDALAPVLAGQNGDLVVTPHAGEMATLLDRPKAEIEADPLAAACEASRRLGGVVVMKGGQTFIVGPDGRAFVNLHGHVGLATSGSGDTLAGLICGLLARGAPPIEAAAWGVFVHAAAGAKLGRRLGGIGYLARALPAAFAEVLGELSPIPDAPA